MIKSLLFRLVGPSADRSSSSVWVSGYAAYLGYLVLAILPQVGITPFVSEHAAQAFASPSAVGRVMGVGALGSLVILPLAWWLIQMKPRWTLVLGPVLTGGAALGMAWTSHSVWGLSLCLMLLNAGGTLAFTAVSALNTTQLLAEHRALRMAYLAATLQVANLLGPLCVEPLIYGRGLEGAALIIGTSGILVVPLVGSRVGRTMVPGRRAAGGTHSCGLRAIPVLQYTLVMGGMSVAFAVQRDFLTAFAASRAITWVSPFFVGYAIVMLVARLRFGGLPDRFGRFRISGLSMLIHAAFFLMLSEARSALHLGALGLVAGLANSLSWPAMWAKSYELLTVPAHAAVLNSLLVHGGGAFGSYSAGLLAARTGYSGLYAATATLVMVTACYLLLLARTEPRPRNTSLFDH